MPNSTSVIATPGPRVAQPTPAEAAERLALKRRLPTSADVAGRGEATAAAFRL